MADDPYVVLGVPRGASEDDIRRAFRKLAKEFHPDVNPGRGAEDRFKRASSAHDFLLDTDKRRRYDRGEIDAGGEPVFPPRGSSSGSGSARAGRSGRSFEDFGFSDVFTDVFGERARSGMGGMGAGASSGRGPDVRYSLEVDFLEAVNGAKKRVTLPDGGVLDLAVPEGVIDGQVLRLRGKGGAGPIEAGDALVEVRVRPHAVFRRQGDDVLFEVPVTIDEAVLGAKIEVETPSGRVHVTLPKGTNSGSIFRLKGKGVRNASSGAHGDCLVAAKIVLPSTIDDALSYFMSEWRQKNKYDPGKR